MALLSVIRRWHFREGIAIREIERRTGLSRATAFRTARFVSMTAPILPVSIPSKIPSDTVNCNELTRTPADVETGKSS